ncbi:MAG: sensor histidine kinase [Steroidobacteraceae bacterium]
MSSWWQRQSVKLRLTLWYALALSLVLAFFAVAVYEIVEHRMENELDRQLRIDFDLVEAQLDMDQSGRVSWHVQGAHGDEGFARLSAWFEVWSEDGRLLFRHWPVPESQIKRPLPAPESTTLQFRGHELEDDLPVRLMERPARLLGHGVVLRMFRDQAGMRQTLRQIVEVFALMLPFAVALAALGGYLLARRSMVPVSAMAAQARRITSESLEARLPNPNPHDEIGQLATVVNDTLSRLESSFRELKRFTADASHELRTPLTALRAVGEVALRRPDDPAALREALQSMLEEAQRLTELTEALLTLARTESGPVPLRIEPLNLAEVARQVTQSLGILATDKEQELDVADAEVTAIADRTLLRQALLNIVHNAIRHSPEKARIAVRVRRSERDAIIEVIDQGPGIDVQHQARVFDRFFRVDPGRSRSAGGYGLGLAIAKASIERCGGRIEIDSELGRGSTFRIRLPA